MFASDEVGVVFNNATVWPPPNTEEACHRKITRKADRGKQISIKKSFIYSTEHEAVRETRGKRQPQHPLRGNWGPLPSRGAASERVSRPGLVWWVCREAEDKKRYQGEEGREGADTVTSVEY